MYKPYLKAFSSSYSTTYIFGKEKHYNNACFSSIFSKLTAHDKISVFICTDDSIIKRNKANYCPLTLKEMKSWMNACKRVINFSYRFTKGQCDFNKTTSYYDSLEGIISNGYWCHITFGKDTNNVERKYILTWLRYMYEGLYCPYVYLTYRLHETEGYRGIPLRKIFLDMLWVFNETTTGHSFGRVKYTSNTEIKKNIKEIKYRLNDVFDRRDGIENPLEKPYTFGELYEYPLEKIIKACNNFKE